MHEGPVWTSLVSQGLLKRLDPGVPANLDRRPDVVVVGGGSLGLAIAVACRRARLGRVIVLERARLAAGATGASAGVLAPEPHVWSDPPALVEFGRESLRLTRALDAEWSGALRLRDLDCLIAGVQLDEAPIPLEVPVEVLRADALREHEPALAGIEEALLVRDQACVNPLRFAAALAGHAGTVATGIEVGEARLAHDRIVALDTSAGEVHPGAVVYATGVAPRPYVTVPHRLVKGHLLTTEPANLRLRSQVVTPLGGALQLEDGRLLAGGTLDEGDDSPAVRTEIVEAIRRGLDRVLPAAEGVPLSHAWCGFRPAAPDRLPIIDRVPGLTNAWFTSGHYRTGILMAAATGASLAKWIGSGSRPANLSAFGLARFP